MLHTSCAKRLPNVELDAPQGAVIKNRLLFVSTKMFCHLFAQAVTDGKHASTMLLENGLRHTLTFERFAHFSNKPYWEFAIGSNENKKGRDYATRP